MDTDKSLKILIVDNDKSNRDSAKTQLNGYDLTICTIDSGLDYSRSEQHKFDTILTDIGFVRTYNGWGFDYYGLLIASNAVITGVPYIGVLSNISPIEYVGGLNQIFRILGCDNGNKRKGGLGSIISGSSKIKFFSPGDLPRLDTPKNWKAALEELLKNEP